MPYLSPSVYLSLNYLILMLFFSISGGYPNFWFLKLTKIVGINLQ